eukprot:TRINITY_DN1353_c0_g1_i2.p1 TRINITY_DN1353_c0_g1~~TRINITY_DN1353_c0_g1_i2.p1  ORF type:complete len:179 (-),score=36.96 TRINITY_DN1353_c0_g1_i2:279-782(-)
MPASALCSFAPSSQLTLPSVATPVPGCSSQGSLTGSISGFRPSLKSSYLSSRRSKVALFRASAEVSGTQKEIQEAVGKLKAKWDELEDKTVVAIYGGGGIVTIWLSSVLLSAIDRLPILPSMFELIGTYYSTWFVYRYLLFKSSRRELAVLLNEFTSKITGTPEKTE